MGQNLARNVAHKGFPIAVHNRTTAKTDKFIEEHGHEGQIVGSQTTEEFVNALATPRAIMIMVKAGQPVDDVIDELKPLLDKGDLLIDGGNSLFTDTERRVKALEAEGFRFLGTGVSGGEEGALNGPSIMPGGSREAYHLVEPIFTKIAAQVDGTPCCTYIGDGGAGHYVKMVHNGIEYADMQLIAEAYDLLHNGLGLDNDELHEVFSQWNEGDLDSFLIEITMQIFARKDDDGDGFLVDKVLDRAAQKGTGKWTVQSALDLGIPITGITEAVFARALSSFKDQRVAASKVLPG
nr:NADP-dependent phosphogluconate dehydrogenase [Armatimonadota bacterium]